jgi:hypothetical protein
LAKFSSGSGLYTARFLLDIDIGITGIDHQTRHRVVYLDHHEVEVRVNERAPWRFPMTPDSDYARTDTYPGHISPLFGAPANIGHRLLVVMELIIRGLQSGQFRTIQYSRLGHESLQ